MKVPLLVYGVCAFASGVAFATLSPLPYEGWLLVLVIAAGVLVVRRRSSSAVSTPYLALLAILLISFAIGGIRTYWHSTQFGHSLLETKVGKEVALTGVVSREPDVRERSQHLYIKTDSDTVLVTTDRLAAIAYGDVVTVAGDLERPESFETDLGRTFNYVGYLLARGVEYKVSFAEVAVVEADAGNPFISLLLTTKQSFVGAIDRAITEPAAGLGKGLLLGVKAALGDDIEEDFRRTGIIHIVVLSGYNVMLVVTFMLFCLSFLLPLRGRVIGGIVAIISFALIVGLSATVVRASIMATLVLIAQATGRRYEVLRALFFAGGVMLLINPYLLLYDIGFQLSFMATLGLLAIVPYFESSVMEGKQSLLDIKSFFLATVATQIAVLPLLMYHIGEVSLIAVVVNVLVLPIVPLAMLLTFAAGLVAMVSTSLGIVVGYGASLSLGYILWVAATAASLPFAAVTLPPLSPWWILVLYVLLGVAWYRFTSRGATSATAAWTVVDEADIQNDAEQSSASDGTLPVFFR